MTVTTKEYKEKRLCIGLHPRQLFDLCEFNQGEVDCNSFNALVLTVAKTNTPFISPNAQSLRTELHFQFIRFAAATLLFAFTPSVGFPHFGECGLKNGATPIEQKDIRSSPQCIVWPFPPHYSVHPFTLTTEPSQTAAFG